MMKQTIFTLLVLSALGINAQAQIVNLSDAGSGQVFSEKKYASIIGSPFLEDEWVMGKVTDEQGKKYDDLYLKYNAFEDHLELLQDGAAIILENDLIKEFQMIIPQGNKIVTKTFRNGYENIDPQFSRNGFYEVLYAGEYSLLKKHFVNKVKISQTGYNIVEDQVQFVANDQYYFVKPNGEAVKFKMKKKFVAELFEDKKKEMNSFVKQKNINYKDENEVAQMVEYYDTLKEQ